MTEAEKIICKMYLENYGKYKDCNEYKLLMGLLEQESCEDVINREKAKEYLYKKINEFDDELYDIFSRIIDDMYNELSSVEQESKTGHWINKSKQSGCGVNFIRIECSECGEFSGFYARYCPWCGAKMVKLQESEV